jgi:hypothetical protein
VAEAFEKGGGVKFEEFGPDCVSALDMINAGQYEQRLLSKAVGYWMLDAGSDGSGLPSPRAFPSAKSSALILMLSPFGKRVILPKLPVLVSASTSLRRPRSTISLMAGST